MTVIITCPRCGMTSCNPHDVLEGYCSNCRAWTSVPDIGHDPDLAVAVTMLSLGGGRFVTTEPIHYTAPVEGEVLPALPRCPHCKHLLSEHYREHGTCMYSTPLETWACACAGPDPLDGGPPGMQP